MVTLCLPGNHVRASPIAVSVLIFTPVICFSSDTSECSPSEQAAFILRLDGGVQLQRALRQVYPWLQLGAPAPPPHLPAAPPASASIQTFSTSSDTLEDSRISNGPLPDHRFSVLSQDIKDNQGQSGICVGLSHISPEAPRSRPEPPHSFWGSQILLRWPSSVR